MTFMKSISVICLAPIVGGVFDSASAVNMTSQIQRLLNEKEQKMAELEKCEGKKKGFMIAGISTIGLTAVGIGGNIALASKSNKLSAELETKNQELQNKEQTLAGVNAQISAAEIARKCEQCREDGKGCDEKGNCIDGIPVPPVVVSDGTIGEACDNGTWVQDNNGDKDCQGDGEPVKCTCKPSDSGDGAVAIIDEGCGNGGKIWTAAANGTNVCKRAASSEDTEKCECKESGNKILPTPKPKTNLELCLEERKGMTPEARACCYLPSTEAKLSADKTKCECTGGKTFQINSDGNGGACISDNPWGAGNNDAKIEECFNRIRNYLVKECPKCVGSLNNTTHEIEPAIWEKEGHNTCIDIVAGGGYYKTTWEGNDDKYTKFLIYASDGSSNWLFCPRNCGKI